MLENLRIVLSLVFSDSLQLLVGSAASHVLSKGRKPNLKGVKHLVFESPKLSRYVPPPRWGAALPAVLVVLHTTIVLLVVNAGSFGKEQLTNEKGSRKKKYIKDLTVEL